MTQLLASFILALIAFISSIPVGAMDPAEEESGAAASGAAAVDASSKSPLELLPLEIQYKIFESLSPKEVNSVARASKTLRDSVSKFRTYCHESHQHLVRAAMRAHESNPAEYGLPMFSTPKRDIEKNIDSDMFKHLSPHQAQDIWAEFDIFAATPNSPLYEIAERMAGIKKPTWLK